MEPRLIADSIKFAAESFKMDVAYNSMQGSHTPTFQAIANGAGFIARCFICAMVGHRLVDDGYGGPESGCVDIGCKRCGFNYGRTYLY